MKKGNTFGPISYLDLQILILHLLIEQINQFSLYYALNEHSRQISDILLVNYLSQLYLGKLFLFFFDTCVAKNVLTFISEVFS